MGIYKKKKGFSENVKNSVDNIGDIMAVFEKVTTLLCGGTAIKNLLYIAPISQQ
jgi:hypothetical protein